MNNVDLAKQQLRVLQQKLYDTNMSTNQLNNFLEQEVIPLMDKASIEIKANYAEISKKLTDEMNIGVKQ